MSNVLRVLSGLAGAAGKGFEGYAVDQQIKVKDALAQAKAVQDEERNRVLNLVAQGGINPELQGRIAGARAQAEVAPSVEKAKALSPITVETAVNTAKGVEPIHTQGAIATHKGERTFDINNPLPVQPSYSFTTGEDDNGKPVIFKGNNKTGELSPTGVKAKSPTTKIESAINTAARARMKAAISEMNNAHSSMDEFENGLASGKIKIAGAEQLLQRMANAFTHDDPLSQTIQSTTLAALNQSNPELARYIRRGLSFAEGESMISQRPSDFRTKMAAFLSTAASGASPEMIHDIQSRRNSILVPLNQVNTQGEDGGGRSSSLPKLTQAQYDAGIAKGHTPQEIAQHYDVSGLRVR